MRFARFVHSVSHGRRARRKERTASGLKRLHVESGGSVVGSLDGSLELLIPTGDNSDEDELWTASLAPGLGVYAGDKMIWGLRVPMFFFLSGETDDRAQVTIEPFLRFNLGSQGFMGVRFNVPLDKPLTDADMWGLHWGGGGAF